MRRALALLAALAVIANAPSARAAMTTAVRVPLALDDANLCSAEDPFDLEDASDAGSFLQRDPLGYIDSVNLYTGFAHDPVNERDPTGMNRPPRRVRLPAEVETEATAQAEAYARVGRLPPRHGVRITLIGSRADYYRRLTEALKDLPENVQARLNPTTIRARGKPEPIESLKRRVHEAEFEAAIARMPAAEAEAFRPLLGIFRGESEFQALPSPRTATDWRDSPGLAHGEGVGTVGPRQWLRQGRVAHVPEEVAARLRGQTFRNFSEFQSAFWKAVAQEPQLLQQFSPPNQVQIRKGNAPFAPTSQRLGNSEAYRRYNLHHKKPISEGGGVYDLDNILVASPLQHYRGLHGQGE